MSTVPRELHLPELRAPSSELLRIKSEAERLGVTFIVAYKVDQGRYTVVCRRDGIGRRAEYVTWVAFTEADRASFVWGHYGIPTLAVALEDVAERS